MEYASNIRASGETLLFLINDILDMSKIESGRMDILPVEYKLSDILRELYYMISIRAQEKGLDLNFEVSKDMPGKLLGDEVRINQIITNLLANAVKYTNQGSVKLRAWHEKGSDDGMLLKVSIADTGIGIRREDMGRLFESCRRLDEEKNRRIEGTGLGMNITMYLLRMMGGELEVSSEYGRGSVFTASIPQKILGEEKFGIWEDVLHAGKDTERQAGIFFAPAAKILVVDDNPMNLTVVRGLLKRTGVQIITAQGNVRHFVCHF